jgi:hypothetical protein
VLVTVAASDQISAALLLCGGSSAIFSSTHADRGYGLRWSSAMCRQSTTADAKRGRAETSTLIRMEWIHCLFQIRARSLDAVN